MTSSIIRLDAHHSPHSYTAISCDDLFIAILFSPHKFSNPKPTPASTPACLASSPSS